MSENYCAGCGMLTKTIREYHPFAACAIFKILLSSDQSRGNLKAVVEYGMDAQKAGVSLEQAMEDFNTVFKAKEQQNDTKRRGRGSR